MNEITCAALKPKFEDLNAKLVPSEDEHALLLLLELRV